MACEKILGRGDKLKIGPESDNECCVCCGAQECSAAYENTVGQGCPSHCCPCPPMGSVIASFASTQCAPLDGLELTFTRALGIPICSGDNPQHESLGCYKSDFDTSTCGIETPNGPELSGCGAYPEIYQETLHNFEYEKWGFSGLICDGDLGAECTGQNVKMSLCCCDHMDASAIGTGTIGDCHSCRYQFQIQFQTHDPNDVDSYCSCPTGEGYGGADAFALPFCEPGSPVAWPCGSPESTLTMTASDCDIPGLGEAWTLTYALTDVYWNCDCCAGGADEGDDTVDVTVTFTKAD